MIDLAPATSRPVASVISFFVIFKSFLLLIAFAATLSPDYDTSTSLFFERFSPGSIPSAASLSHSLTRWDGIYFVAASLPDGVLYEQQWAFGPAGLPALISSLSRLCGRTGHGPQPNQGAGLEPLLAIIVSHVSHLTTVIALYHLTLRLSRDVRLAVVSAMLHVISPAGLFLSAPYAESPFACLTFLGHLLAVLSFEQSAKSDLALVGAGVLYGVSTLFRSNGLISGALFAVEAVVALFEFLQHTRVAHVRRLIAAVVGGLCVAAGSVFPQYQAWKIYCQPEALRPWCSQLIPSIYTYVQAAYWNVGFLRYWKVEQLPLFLLAAPMLCLLIKSGLDTARTPQETVALKEARLELFVRVLAVSQTALAVLAITNYHVQIISRISTAYPVWYWWVAKQITKNEKARLGRIIPTFMVLYAGIQGGLFASFLPPA